MGAVNGSEGAGYLWHTFGEGRFGGMSMRRTIAKLVGVVVVLLAGGAACTPPPPDGVLAIAYVNVDGIAGYDESADVLIAKLVDTNADGIVSVGDTITTGQYPLDFDATAVGNFTSTNHEVTEVIDSTRGLVWVANGYLPNREHFLFSSAVRLFPPFSSERYLESSEIWTLPVAHVTLDDSNVGGDGIEAVNDAPSGPDTAVSISRDNATDDPFLDVDVFVE